MVASVNAGFTGAVVVFRSTVLGGCDVVGKASPGTVIRADVAPGDRLTGALLTVSAASPGFFDEESGSAEGSRKMAPTTTTTAVADSASFLITCVTLVPPAPE